MFEALGSSCVRVDVVVIVGRPTFLVTLFLKKCATINIVLTTLGAGIGAGTQTNVTL